MLSISTIKERITPICKAYGVEKVFLFGSYARGEATEASDVDLRIEKGKIKDLFTLSGFRLDVMDILKNKVDILIGLPNSKKFKKNLSKDEVLIYATKWKRSSTFNTYYCSL